MAKLQFALVIICLAHVCLSARIVREADDASAVTPTAVPATTQATLPAVTPASAANKTTDAEVKLENSDEEFEKQKKEIFDIIPKEYVTEIDAVFTRVLAGKTGDDKALARFKLAMMMVVLADTDTDEDMKKVLKDFSTDKSED